MKIFYIELDTIEKVKSFVHDMDRVEGEAVICHDRCYADAKSILGIFSLDLTKPLELKIRNWKSEYGILLKKYISVSC